MIVALILGTLLAVGALVFVLSPLFVDAPRPVRPDRIVLRQTSTQEQAVAALREIEFDRQTGKLSEADYIELKTRYTREAIAAMRRDAVSAPIVAAPVGGGDDDEIEAAVRAYRAGHAACPTCGPRPESDAVFCSNCGRYLRDRCADCGAPVDALDARYCVGCGNRLAA